MDEDEVEDDIKEDEIEVAQVFLEVEKDLQEEKDVPLTQENLLEIVMVGKNSSIPILNSFLLPKRKEATNLIKQKPSQFGRAFS